MTASSSARFRQQFAAFEERTEFNAEQVVRGIALALLSGFVRRTPVLTGRARGNWFVQEDTGERTASTADKSGGATIANGATLIAKFKVGGKLYLLNHLPYINKLEYGHSQQAPSGMVRITLEELNQYLEAEAQKVKK